MASLGTDSLGPPPATSLESESNLGGDHMSSATVAVVGGGYGGIIAAKALEEFADVVLIEPRDTFVHHNATPRALIDPQWAEHLFLPYSGILRHGRVVRARAEKVEEQRISLDTGEQITADFIVLATGAAGRDALGAACGLVGARPRRRHRRPGGGRGDRLRLAGQGRHRGRTR